jgi:hypothetical protein
MIEPAGIKVRLFPIQIHKIFNHDILGLRNKPTIPGTCRFPLTNLHFAESVDFVPKSNLLKQLILYYICSDNTQPNRPFFAIYRKNSRALSIFHAVYRRISRWE